MNSSRPRVFETNIMNTIDEVFINFCNGMQFGIFIQISMIFLETGCMAARRSDHSERQAPDQEHPNCLRRDNRTAFFSAAPSADLT